MGFIDSMEKEKHIVAQLRVKANHTIVKSGKRMELLFPTHCGQDIEMWMYLKVRFYDSKYYGIIKLFHLSFKSYIENRFFLHLKRETT